MILRNQANSCTEKMMDKAQSNPLSFFSIGGIHGLPHEPWDNAIDKTKPRGYCTHGTNIFPTWHRVYVALFEVGFLLFLRQY